MTLQLTEKYIKKGKIMFNENQRNRLKEASAIGREIEPYNRHGDEWLKLKKVDKDNIVRRIDQVIWDIFQESPESFTKEAQKDIVKQINRVLCEETRRGIKWDYQKEIYITKELK